MPFRFRRLHEPVAVPPTGERHAFAALHEPHELDGFFLEPDGPLGGIGRMERADGLFRAIAARETGHDIENGRELELLRGMREIFAHHKVAPLVVLFSHAD